MPPRTLAELNAIRDECKTMVTKRAGLSAGAAVIPIPGMDIGADVSLLVAISSLGLRVATKSAAKFVPILGQALAAGISFGAMRMVGNSHVDDCYEVAKKLTLAAPTEVQAPFFTQK